MAVTTGGESSVAGGAPATQRRLWVFFLRAFRNTMVGAAGLGLAFMLLMLGSSISVFCHVSAMAQSGSGASTGAGTGFTAADLQKQVQDQVSLSIKDEKELLDKLLLTVGLYTTILSFLALATAIISRQDAKDQLGKVDSLHKELKSQVQTEFPFISDLQSRVLRLIHELETKYPSDENLNQKQENSWKIEKQHQDVLIDELTIVAVSVVVLDKPSLLKLYMVLSRSYFDRFRTGMQEDSDAARAILYASRAIEFDNSFPEAYLMRGVSAFARFRTAETTRHTQDDIEKLLPQAKSDLERCFLLDPYNAGAVYNLALLYDMDGNRGKAISISETLLSPDGQKNVSRRGQEKYFADVYINLACYFADESKARSSQKEKEAIWDHVVQICRDGKEYLTNSLKSTRAKETFRKSLSRELEQGKDFSPLPDAWRDMLNQLL